MKSITQKELERLIDSGEILEKDRYGVKVVRLIDDRYLKIFNNRPGYSAAKIFPRSKRFANNAKKLKKRRITTVGIIELFNTIDAKRNCVIYHGIPGKTLREVMRNDPENTDLSRKAGAYIAQLHDAGVMFRSLHFGNIIQLADGSFGLIDVADMRVHLFPLSRWQRQRNFQHIFRYKKDYLSIECGAFVDGYVEASRQSGAGLRKLIVAAIEKSKLRQIG